MKRQTLNKLGVAAFTLAASGVVGSAPAGAIPLSGTSVELNGQPLMTSVAPIRNKGVTLVPMRDIFEALGATVNYNSLTRGIIAQRNSTTVGLQIGNRRASINGQDLRLNQPPVIVSGSTLVPLRFVSEALGANVSWNGARQLVSIQQAGSSVASYRRINIPSGAVVPVTLDTALSSDKSRTGDVFTATVKSDAPGDSEFPAGTRIEGVVTEAMAHKGKNPGVLGLDFRAAILPNGTRVSIAGSPSMLDNKSVTQTGGRIMAKEGKDNSTRNILIGGAGGVILGKVFNRNSTNTGILGAAAGYLFSRKDKKADEVRLKAGSDLGVRIDRNVGYQDTTGYLQQRSNYVKM